MSRSSTPSAVSTKCVSPVISTCSAGFSSVLSSSPAITSFLLSLSTSSTVSLSSDTVSTVFSSSTAVPSTVSSTVSTGVSSLASPVSGSCLSFTVISSLLASSSVSVFSVSPSGSVFSITDKSTEPSSAFVISASVSSSSVLSALPSTVIKSFDSAASAISFVSFFAKPISAFLFSVINTIFSYLSTPFLKSESSGMSIPSTVFEISNFST